MMIADTEELQNLLLSGCFGLEMESLRVNEDGYFSHSPHPFPESENIVRDFCENQTEINTAPTDSARKAVAELTDYYYKVQRSLSERKVKEYLWPFSNPPYIKNEEDIPVAQFDRINVSKTNYRNYLSDRYGRYKMTFSGIHVNYSFHEEILQNSFIKSEEADYQEFKSQFYVELAEKVCAYGWILVAITAASPVLDSSFVEKGRLGEDVFLGLASVRCSELGYWNYFAPIFNYTNLQTYVDSMREYVEKGWIKAASELYYPVRLKPKGENTLENLLANGVNHIELRMFDLNPLAKAGVEEKDLVFVQLFLAWLAAIPRQPLSEKDQVQAVQNFKNAAHYDLKTVKIVAPNGEVCSVVQAAKSVLSMMREFYQGFSAEVFEILDFEEAKFEDAENRYAWKIREQYGRDYVKEGLKLAKRKQEEANV